MEDEQKDTLKKKIQILFQLGKWPDVVKLCASYGEKYGKDMDIDMIRFKSERHLGMATSSVAGPPAGASGPDAEGKPLLLSAEDQVAGGPAAQPDSGKGAAEFRDVSRAGSRVAEEEPEEPFGGEPYAEEELVITDPFAEDGPGLSLASDEPPIDLRFVDEGSPAERVTIPALEMEMPSEPDPAPEPEVAFANIGPLTLDAEPDLMPGKSPEIPVAAQEQEGTEEAPFPSRAPVAPSEEESPPSFAPAEERPPFEEPFRSMAGGAERVDQVEEMRPGSTPGPVFADEPLRPRIPFQEPEVKRSRGRGIAIRPRTAILVAVPLLAALVAWLLLSGKLSLPWSGGAQAVVPSPAEPPLVRPPRPVKKVVPPAVMEKENQKEKEFTEKLRLAEDLFRKGENLKAWSALLEAKKIKVTEPLSRLEQQLSEKIRAESEKEKQQAQLEANQWQAEGDAFARAEKENTIDSWKEFVQRFPNSERISRVHRKIAALEKMASENARQQLLSRMRQARKVKLRTTAVNLSQAEVAALLRPGARPPAQIEAHEHGGSKVMLDLATGLMWTLWNKPMAYEKARWWANRVTAGYSGWRLPTAEEALSLLQMDRSLYAGLPDFVVWTGDGVSDQARTAWALRVPDGPFVAVAHSQIGYVWAVRQAVK
ncbi:MAG: DUF1566 domain-containing protein [Candidatus Aminicenantes bacterium]|nr:DUF1566 domain-containing protein [Candidatus Aminicenantes bacterium]